MIRWIAALGATTLLSCTLPKTAPTPDLDADMADLRARYGLTSIAAVVVRDGAVVVSDAWGFANVDADIRADSDTLYGLASCSKPVVGLALALLLEEHPDIDLDTDINDILDWDPPVAHPHHPDAQITLRHLIEHRSGIAVDSAADYESYPKPDPDQSLRAFMQAVLAQDSGWLRTAPGDAEKYSNLGVALAALIIEEASGEDFRDFTQRRLFDPLGMSDTRWFYGDLSPEQQARHAIPYDDDGMAYAIYGFNDYPSGQLRSTADDMGKLLIMLMNQGGSAVSPAAVQAFEDTPMLIEAGVDGPTRVFDHAGSEAGVSTYLTYGDDGVGYAWMINTDVVDEATDNALFVELSTRLRAEALR